MRLSVPRLAAGLGVTLAVAAPLALLVYQSFLSDPFFDPRATLSLEAYQYVLTSGDFHRAFLSSFAVSFGMTAIALPLGSLLGFLVARTDLPGKHWLEPWLLVPVFLSPIVLAFGYVVAVGPVGFFSLWTKALVGTVPWNLYSIAGLIVIAGLTHVPHVFIYVSAALRGLDPSVEEAARVTGAGPWRIAFSVSLPLVRPAILFSGALVFLLGFELFGLPLVLGDPAGLLVLTTYLYKLTNLLGVPSYQLMAVVAVSIVAITFPLVYFQRRMVGAAARYAVIGGKGRAFRPLPLGALRWPMLAIVILWLLSVVVLPLAGIALRSVVRSWGEGVALADVLTLDHFRDLLQYPNLVRGIANTLAIGALGGALAVAVYALIALSAHRAKGIWPAWLDYLSLVPRALPGLVVGLAFFWLFLFVKPIAPLRTTLFSLWLAYSVVWLAYGLKLITATLMQVAPDLEDAARVTGAGPARIARDVTLPLIRFGLIGSWLLIFMMFVREYSTGVYLLGPGTEVIGSLIVALWGTGALDLISALSVVEVLIVGAALLAALRLGVRLDA
ncbi:MAG TPA: iron ABC transporter permease [Candidatus Binatia bacterium]|jgi:iron(III) transport system permease protein